ncbi:MAG TPA: glycerate kinase [Tepidisphaeraceae bacterium]|nr:glycerate kinase [Tepidisphaeraceae bacterium]
MSLPKRVLIAPDKFKDSLDAIDVARAVERGIRGVDSSIEIDLCPLTDGGEGFCATMTAALGGVLSRKRIVGPLAEMHVDASFGIAGDVGVVEMSSASGLALIPKADRNPMFTTTFGTGQLIVSAVEAGAKKILLGIGGSATCDGGVGALQACGCHIILKSGEYARDSEPLRGKDVDEIVLIKSHRGSIVDGVEITIACDVTNPLCGPNGSARIYGPQKGASPSDVEFLDRSLRELAHRMGKDDLAQQPGAGAAGGIGFGLAAMFGAKLVGGFELVSNALRLRERIISADLVITGEGHIDHQTPSGKTVAGVARLCRELSKPCCAIAGAVSLDATSIGIERAIGIRSLASSDDDSFRNASKWIEQAARQIIQDRIGK